MSTFLRSNSDKDKESLPTRRSLRSDQGGSFAPSSPTDRLLSPTTKRLWGPKRIHSPDISKEGKLNAVSLDKHVVPMPFPYEDVDLVLGTSSANRKQIVDKLGWKYTQISPDIDEKAIRDPDPLELPLKIAKAKADALIAKLQQLADSSPKLVVTADQIVLFERSVREKPVDRQEAVAFLSSYSGKSVSTVSAMVVTHYPSLAQASGVDVATVFWEQISKEVVEKVVDKGRVFTSAGGFQVEDEDLCELVKAISGSIDSVMGLPIGLTLNIMEEVMGTVETPDGEREGEGEFVAVLDPL